MYGFSENIDLSHLLEGELVRISIDKYNLLFVFDAPENTINISGEWEIRNDNNEVIDHGIVETEKDSYKVHQLLGAKIKKCEVRSKKCLVLTFDNNWELELIDNSDQYESFSISPDIYI